MRPRKSMGGIVIGIWEKSNFFGPFGSLNGAKNAVFYSGRALKAPPPYGRVKRGFWPNVKKVDSPLSAFILKMLIY